MTINDTKPTVGPAAAGKRGDQPGGQPGRSAADVERMRLPMLIAGAALSLGSVSRLLTSQLAYGALAAIGLLHVLTYLRFYLRVRISLTEVAYLVVCVASIFWSVNRSTTIARMPSLVSFVLLALLVGPALGLAGLCEVFTKVTRFFVAVALLAGYAFPDWAKDPGIPGETGWASIVASKNYLGLLGVLCFASAILAPTARRRVLWAALSVLLVLNSRSATSLALVFVTLGSAGFSLAVRQFNSKRKQRFIIAFLTAVAGAFALSVVLDASFAAGLLGRDGTLTGRTAIWDFVWRRIKERPWLGHGYQAYWNVENEFTISIKRTVGFPVTSAHQGLLDVLLGVGIVGLIITLVMLGTANLMRTFGDRTVPGGERVSPRLMLWARGIVLIYSIETFSESCLTTVFVVPLLMVIAAITSETTFFQRRSRSSNPTLKSALNI